MKFGWSLLALGTALLATDASAQGINLTGPYRCVALCRNGFVGQPAFVTQNGWSLNLLNEAGEPSRAWIDWTGHIRRKAGAKARSSRRTAWSSSSTAAPYGSVTCYTGIDGRPPRWPTAPLIPAERKARPRLGPRLQLAAPARGVVSIQRLDLDDRGAVIVADPERARALGIVDKTRRILVGCGS